MARAMGAAFADDPMFAWLFPAAGSRAAKLEAWFGNTMRLWPEPGKGHLFTTDDHAGAAVWHEPGSWKIPNRIVFRLFPRTVRLFGVRSLTRMLGALSVIEKNHPAEEHWYLEWLATDPPMQRKGVGVALMAPVLERCDADGRPAYLETQKPENVAYYRRHGFEVRGEADLAKDGPHVWFMWREPRT